MSEFGGLRKHENSQWNVAAQVAVELKTVTYATLPMEERRKTKKENVTPGRQLAREVNVVLIYRVANSICTGHECTAYVNRDGY